MKNLDHVFAALSDATRRAIVVQLAAGPARVTDLAEPYAMSLPAVSKHLKVLERAGLIKRERDGRVHRIHLRPEGLVAAGDWLKQMEHFWSGSLDKLDEILSETQDQDRGSKK